MPGDHIDPERDETEPQPVLAGDEGGYALSGDDTILGKNVPPKARLRDLARGRAVGRYVILQRIGAGGMGVVFAAYDPKLDRRVAIKLLVGVSDGDPLDTSSVVRLQREGQAMAKLSHPNVVTVFDVGTIEDSVFIAMEYVEGQTLREWREEGEGVDAPWHDVVAKYVAAGRGLAAAHAAGIVHRDFKPDNVMVTAAGDVKVLDFGLARPDGVTEAEPSEAAASNSSFDVRLTATGAVMGTPYYMAPEQHQGKLVDAATDQFSFSVALYEALYERRPFAGDSMMQLALSVTSGTLREPPKASSVPASIRSVVMRGLSAERGDRHPSMQSMLGALQPRSKAPGVWLVAGSGIALTAAAVLTFASDRNDACRQLDGPISEVWDVERSGAIATHLAREQVANERARAAVAAFDRFSEEWVGQRTDACQAARVHGSQTENVLELRYGCLDDRLGEFGFALNRVEQGDRVALFALSDIVAELPSLEPCSDVEGLRLEFPLPDDPQVRRRVRELQELLFEIHSSKNRGDLATLLSRYEAFDSEAVATGHVPIIALGRAAWGEMEVFDGKAEQGAERIEAAYLSAMSVGANRTAVRILNKLIRVQSERLSDSDTAEFLGRLANAMLETMPNSADLRIYNELARGQVYSTSGKLEEAERHIRSAVEAQAELGRGTTASGIQARAFLAWILLQREEEEAAGAMLDTVLEEAVASLGHDHPEVATALIFRARTHSMSDDPEQALVALEESRLIWLSLYGPTHYNVLAVQSDMAMICMRDKRFAEGKRIVKAAIESGEALDGLARGLSTMYMTLAQIEFHGGDPAAALEALGHAQKNRAAVRGGNPATALDVLLIRARIHLALGDFEEARADLEDVKSQVGPERKKLSDYFCGIGELALAEDDYAAANTSFERALELALEHKEPISTARAKLGLARVSEHRGDTATALRLAREVHVISKDLPTEARVPNAAVAFVERLAPSE